MGTLPQDLHRFQDVAFLDRVHDLHPLDALAATFPVDAALPEGWQVIGEVVEGGTVTVDGRPWYGPKGWDHFRA